MKASIVTAMILVRTSLFLFAINFSYHDISFPQFSPDYEILAPILVVFWEWFWIHFLTHSFTLKGRGLFELHALSCLQDAEELERKTFGSVAYAVRAQNGPAGQETEQNMYNE